jgi:calcineurin-like phosphoesterase family protein
MKGFLFIGDPHVSSLRPGRRIDDFAASVLEKLRLAGEIARREELVPVILGDLFHRARENHLPTLSRLTKVLQGYPVVPLIVGGNHDKEETQLREADALYLLAQTGVIDVFDGECREARRFQIDGQTVSLWMAPYGSAIPSQISAPGADMVVLVTHHDLAFEGAYPGAAVLQEVRGCNIAVNGHMHKTAPPVVRGMTHWHCPGNIEPLSVDCIDHVPAVWSWHPAAPGELKAIPLPHQRDCFDMAGLMIPASPAAEAVEALIPTQTSHFAELLSANTRLEAARADDNESFIEELKIALVEIEARAEVQRLLLALAQGEAAPAVALAEETSAASTG